MIEGFKKTRTPTKNVSSQKREIQRGQTSFTANKLCDASAKLEVNNTEIQLHHNYTDCWKSVILSTKSASHLDGILSNFDLISLTLI